MRRVCVKENTHLSVSRNLLEKKGVAYLAQGPTYKTPNKYLGDGHEAEGGNEYLEGLRKTLVSGMNNCVSYEGITMGLRGSLCKRHGVVTIARSSG